MRPRHRCGTRTGSRASQRPRVQYLSIRYTERLAEDGVEGSVGSRGDAYDNALAESVIDCSRRKSFGMPDRGVGWTTSNERRSSGCHGSTRVACWNRSGNFPQRSTKRSFRNSRQRQILLEHSNNRVSDEPGAILRD